MHRGHDHDHHHHALKGAGGSVRPHEAHAAGPGHNHARDARAVTQWQTPHLDRSRQAHRQDAHDEPDLDQVEAAFVEGFAAASDPIGFLRLANVPFEAKAPDGAKLVLLRVETDLVTDVGSVMPHLGGQSFRYDPLPAALVTRRRRLRFIYRDASAIRVLNFAELRTLTAA
jgi:hypothetical protein